MLSNHTHTHREKRELALSESDDIASSTEDGVRHTNLVSTWNGPERKNELLILVQLGIKKR